MTKSMLLTLVLLGLTLPVLHAQEFWEGKGEENPLALKVAKDLGPVDPYAVPNAPVEVAK